jgi:hypothetical protein
LVVKNVDVGGVGCNQSHANEGCLHLDAHTFFEAVCGSLAPGEVTDWKRLLNVQRGLHLVVQRKVEAKDRHCMAVSV